MTIKRIKNGYHNGLYTLLGMRWLYCFGGDIYKDLYDIKNLNDSNEEIMGNELIICSYPDGKSYRPYTIKYGVYYSSIIFINEELFFLKADFNKNIVTIVRYIPDDNILNEISSFNMDELNLYNLSLGKYPLTLFSMDEKFIAYYPEKLEINVTKKDSFVVRNGDTFYFNRWEEERIDNNYLDTSHDNYYESMVKFNKDGKVLSIERGSLNEMPNGEFWLL